MLLQTEKVSTITSIWEETQNLTAAYKHQQSEKESESTTSSGKFFKGDMHTVVGVTIQNISLNANIMHYFFSGNRYTTNSTKYCY